MKKITTILLGVIVAIAAALTSCSSVTPVCPTYRGVTKGPKAYRAVPQWSQVVKR